jgi:hypothetical protein
MRILKKLSLFLGLVTTFWACKKTPDEPGLSGADTPKRNVTYIVKGTKFKLNFIDSTNNFQQNVVGTDGFQYSFAKGAGANIGMSISAFSAADTITSWEIDIDGKVAVIAYSDGSAYFTVPYPTN